MILQPFVGLTWASRTLAVDFDGTNDYAASGAPLAGLSDGKQGLFSAWVRLDGGNGADMMLFDYRRLQVSRSSGDVFMIFGDGTAGVDVMQLETVGTFVAGATWRHILAAWDVSDTNKRHIYVNDVSDLTAITYVDANIDYTNANCGVGASDAGSNKLNGCLAELFFHDTYLDLSVEANRRLFITAAGKPADLGTDGSTPLSAQPRVYLSQRTSTAADFVTNRGTGGGFTLTGALDIASTSPSD